MFHVEMKHTEGKRWMVMSIGQAKMVLHAAHPQIHWSELHERVRRIMMILPLVKDVQFEDMTLRVHY
jgi:hypothetical protein